MKRCLHICHVLILAAGCGFSSLFDVVCLPSLWVHEIPATADLRLRRARNDSVGAQGDGLGGRVNGDRLCFKLPDIFLLNFLIIAHPKIADSRFQIARCLLGRRKLANASWNEAVVFFGEENYEFQTHTHGSGV